MKYCAPLIVVKNMDKSIEFYKSVFGLDIIEDYGANKTLTGGVSLQTLESWAGFLKKDISEINFQGNEFELYFEEDDFDNFIENLENYDIDYVHKTYEASWGQRSLRLYDPDKHIIEIGENMKSVYNRFTDEGINDEEIAIRMDVPLSSVLKFKS